jgi:hypothetical protein
MVKFALDTKIPVFWIGQPKSQNLQGNYSPGGDWIKDGEKHLTLVRFAH